MDTEKILVSMLPALITGFVSMIALITSYKAAKNASKQSYNNNVDSMKFTQKEKVADQLAEKSAILLTKCDPNVLNTVLNEIVPRSISHEENMNIRRRLLGIADEIQTLSNIIKMLTYSIFDSEEFLRKLEDIGNKLDAVNEKCSLLFLRLADVYTAMTPEGRIKNINVMEEKTKLEKSFSEEYQKIYVQLHLALSDLVWYIRQQSIPKDINREKKHKKGNGVHEKEKKGKFQIF